MRVGFVGVNLSTKAFNNFGNLSDLQKNDEVCRMCWFDEDENKVEYALKDFKYSWSDLRVI